MTDLEPLSLRENLRSAVEAELATPTAVLHPTAALCPGKPGGCRSKARCRETPPWCMAHCPCATCVDRRDRAALRAGRPAKKEGPRAIPRAEQPFEGRPRDLDEAAEYGAWLVGRIAAGELDARTGREAAAALNVLMRVLQQRDLAQAKVAKIRDALLKQARDAAERGR